MTTAPQASTVAILLCTRNGEAFLGQQLDSFAAQTHAVWTVWASDDGSTDQTMAMLEQRRAAWGPDKLKILRGPGRGSSPNFLSLACNDTIQADYFSYADQDDIWHADKLARAVAWLDTVPKSKPALYFSRTALVDEAGRDIGLSRLFTKQPGFQNALVQNIGGGNTMVFNQAARAILRAAGNDMEVVVHDWWTYMAVTGAGGVVFSDSAPSLQYRQHSGNQIGSNLGLRARLFRAGLLFEGRFKLWTDINLKALLRIESRLTPKNQQILADFNAARAQKGLIPRLIGVARSGIYRQSFIDNVGLYLAAALNRL
ncbi:MAG: glycosyltransferase family 2 protein [Rhodospirillaceae bacterium]|nr:glycosyltransferase family 2 protein [Rhodospirillaceae bacterium]